MNWTWHCSPGNVINISFYFFSEKITQGAAALTERATTWAENRCRQYSEKYNRVRLILMISFFPLHFFNNYETHDIFVGSLLKGQGCCRNKEKITCI